MQTASLLLESWGTFYVIVGGAAAALTGLQFVVMTLAAGLESRASGNSINAFGTPTVVHFSMVLLAAATLAAPWPTIWVPALLLAGGGSLGLIYSVVVARRALRQDEYEPVFEDWLYHIVLPALAYGALATGGALLNVSAARSLFGLGAAALALLFIGIHNAWDTVIFLILERSQRGAKG